MEELNGAVGSRDMENHIEETHAMLCDIQKDVHRILNRGGTDNMGENFDSGMLAGLLSKQGVDPGIIAMMENARKDGSWGGEGGLLVLLFLIILMGGGNGFWGNRNCAGNDVEKVVFDQSNYDTLMSAVRGNGDAVSQLAQTLNCTQGQITSALASVDKQIAVNQGSIINAVQSCCCNLQGKIQDCCCQTNLNVERQGCQTRQDIQDVRFLIQSTASAQDNLMQSLINSQNQYLASEFCAIKSREDAREIQSLRDKLSEQRDSANTLAILNAIKSKDAIAFQGNAGATAFTGTGTLS